MKYVTRTAVVIVLPDGSDLCTERATRIEIVDESGGEYVEVSQDARTDLGKIAIEPEEWPELREAIDTMIKQCKEEA